MIERCILSECYVDTVLIETLNPDKNGYNHQKGCATIGKIMINKFEDRFCIGIIDRDKKTIGYINEFNLCIETEDLFLYKHKERAHFIIQIAPAAEMFIINAAKSIKLDLSEYGLSNELEELKKYTKSKTSKNDPTLVSAFKALKKSNSFYLLSQWIDYMIKNKYNISIERLKEIANNIEKSK